MLKKYLFFLLTLGIWANDMTVITANTDDFVLLKAKDAIFSTKAQYTQRKLLSCSPDIDVLYRVLSSHKLKLIPRKPWQSGRRYDCTLSKAVSAKNLSFSFTMPDFALEDFHYFDKEKLLRLEFNDKVDMKSLKESMELFKVNALARTSLEYSLSSYDGRVVLVKIMEAMGADLELHLNTKLQTINGTRLKEEILKIIDKKPREEVFLSDKIKAMELKDAPRMVSKEDGSFAIRIFFDDSFYNEPVKKFIHIDGISHFTLKKDVYLSEALKKEFNISNSYYYVDVMSDEFKPNTKYKMTLFKGLYNYRELKEDKFFSFKTKDRKKHISFNNQEMYVSNLAELGFESINVSKATVLVDKITQDNYRYFINYNDAKAGDLDKYSHEIFSKDISLDNPKNVIKKQKIRFADLAKGAKYGVYKVTLAYEDKNYLGKTIHKTASKVLFVSDIGISVNLSQNQAFISLLSLATAKALAGAEVDIYSQNNIRIATLIADKDGIAKIDAKDLMGKKPKAIIVRFHGDKNFLLLDNPSNDMTYKALQKTKERYKAFVYFQSNIIRPSASIHALLSVKDRDFISASSLPVNVQLRMIESEEILLDKVYHTDAFGMIDFTYKMKNEDKTGAYILEVSLGNKRIGKKILDVEAFMPPKIENTIQTDKAFYSYKDFMKVNISSAYLFGSPAGYLSGTLSYKAMAFDYVNKKYKDYSFSNEHLEEENEQFYINQTQNIILNAQGKTELSLSCKSNQTVPSILKVLLGATIMDDTQPVSKYKELFIYPYAHLVGLKLNQEILDKNTPLEGRSVLLDPITGKEINQELSIIIKKIQWHYAYRNGHYHWDSEISIIDSFTAMSNQKFSRKISENGEFIIEVHDRLGGHSASLDFEVSGWGYSNIAPSNDLKSIAISFEDKLYQKGDVLKASFKSPILKGRLLLTLEGEKIYWHKSIEINKGVAKLDIPLDIDLKRGLYIHATAVRTTDTKPNIIPFRAMGYAFVKPNRNAHKIDISLEYNKVTASKKPMMLHIKSTQEAEILVSVVDKGILNITEQKVPKIFDYFNEQPSKKLLYFDLYDEVMQYLSEGNLIAFGSDSDEGIQKRKKHLAPENNDRIKPFMLWSKIIHTKNKEANLSLNIPDFNGKGTIVVIAMNKDSIGVKSDTLIVRDDIIIKPSYPRFLLKGDKIQVPIRVFNSTDKAKSIKLQAQASSIFSLTFDTQKIKIPAKSTKVIYASLEAVKIGKGKIKLFTQLGGEEFSKSVSLMVMTPYALKTYTIQDAISSNKEINIPSKFLGAKVLVSLSDNIIGQLRGELKYLVDYPYGCAEQTSSKISAMFYAKPFMREDKLIGNADNFIRQGIKKLSALQNWRGEFAYWTEGGYVNPYASLYASQTLLALDAGGYTLDKEVKKLLIEALKNIAKGKKLQASYSNSHRVLAGFILSEYNLLDMSTANLLYDKKIYEDYYFSSYYMSAILLNMKQEALAQKVYAKVKNISLKDIANSPNYKGLNYIDFSSKSKDMFLLLYMNSRYFSKSKADFDQAKAQLSKLYSTHEKALAFKAISAYMGSAINEKMEVALELNADTSTYYNPVAFTQSLKNTTIKLRPYSGVVNYMIEAYKPLPHELKNTLFGAKPMRIKREFIDAKGKILDVKNLEQGARIYAKISIENDEAINDIVISERIPACMEIVNTRLSKAVIPFANKNLYLDYKDIRDDRVLHFIHLKKKTKTQNIANKTIFYTPLIVSTRGECKLPAISIEAMYNSRVNDYAKQSDTIVVKSKEESKYTHTNNRAFSPKEIKDRVKAFYSLEAISTDARDFIPYFAYPIKNYFNKSNLSKEEMLKDKDRYNRTWYKKSYDILSTKIIDKDEKNKSYKIKIVFAYTLENTKGKVIKGISKHIVTVKNIRGKLMIIGIGLAK